MKYLFFAAALFFALSGFALGEESALDKIDISSLEKWARTSSDIDAKELITKLISGEYQTDYGAFLDEVKKTALGEIKKAAKYIALLSAPCCVLAALRMVYPSAGVSYALGLVCSLAVTATLITVFGECVLTTRKFLSGVGAFNESVYPIMAAALALSGKTAASALFSPSAALVGSVVSSGIAVYAPLFAVGEAVLAFAGQMSDGIRLDGLERLVKRVYNLCLGAAMTVLLCLIAARGELSKAYDSSSIQTAKFTIGSLLPIVGGEVADSVDALVSSASLLRNAVGVSGIALLAAYCAKPLITLAASAVAARLASALVEPLGENAAQRISERFAEAIDMLLAACAASTVLLVVLLGAAMTLFGG